MCSHPHSLAMKSNTGNSFNHPNSAMSASTAKETWAQQFWPPNLSDEAKQPAKMQLCCRSAPAVAVPLKKKDILPPVNMYKSLIEVEKKRLSSQTASNDAPILHGELPRGALVQHRNMAALSAAKFTSSDDSCEFGSTKYFLLCGVGGILSCGITHTMITPLDLVKCRLQVDSAKYKNLINGFKVTVAEEGSKGLARGWAPTAIGYSAQGLCKFGFYEVFKCFYSDLLGEENSYVYRTWLYLAASASAEFIADIALSPWESAKVKIQTTAGYADTLRECAPKMMKEEGLNAFYKSLVPLWMRQIPYTMMKFACFEKTVEILYKYVVPKPRDQCTKGEQLIVTFAAGYIAGVFCAIVSHPADTVVSKLNQNKEATAGQVLKDLGLMGVWKGLIPRIIMIGTLTAAQWFIYDAVKVYLRLPRPPPPEMPESLKKKLEAAGKL